jgi:DNA repair photolyase
MYGYKEIEDLTLQLILMLNQASIKCTVLTKRCLPVKLAGLGKENEVGITLISLNEPFRQVYEPFSASYKDRIDCLRTLHDQGLKTWVSIEPYPTPNLVKQDFSEILDSVSFVDKIIFGKLNYNSICSKYPNRYKYYNQLSQQVIDFCQQNSMEYHIKKGTMTE